MLTKKLRKNEIDEIFGHDSKVILWNSMILTTYYEINEIFGHHSIVILRFLTKFSKFGPKFDPIMFKILISILCL